MGGQGERERGGKRGEEGGEDENGTLNYVNRVGDL